ncbi:hypothetical protein O181_127301 [Austropuccinia psidii MF-1]|uniref:BED-type domain-containing protein n=1 Tax=Austropuccinia psidii MF-1 TaxID=1389203 RepID=A0A9Q3Q6P8_9BASI|nr:hypothetical protein [Austropuccinia psidii MF-1]
MSSIVHSIQSTSVDSPNPSLPSLSEPPTNAKQSWVWLYFSNVNNKHVECQVNSRSGSPCKKILKHDPTGSTKSMSDHLQELHQVINPKTTNLNKMFTLDNGKQLAFTTNTWTSPNIKAFMAITGHFIDKEFNLVSVILGSHSGQSLANQFLTTLKQYDLEDSIISITTDNALVNQQMAQELQDSTKSFAAKTQLIG